MIKVLCVGDSGDITDPLGRCIARECSRAAEAAVVDRIVVKPTDGDKTS